MKGFIILGLIAVMMAVAITLDLREYRWKPPCEPLVPNTTQSGRAK